VIDEDRESKLIGLKLKKLREDNNYTQSKMADELKVDRSVISKIESGKVKIKFKEYVEQYAQIFGKSAEEIYRSAAVVIVDTSAFLKKPNIIQELEKDFYKVIILDVVIKELDNIKDKRKNNDAWLAMMSIAKAENADIILKENNKKIKNDEKIINEAEKISENYGAKVYILHDDIGFTLRYDNSITLGEYMTKKYGIINLAGLEELDKLYLEDWKDYKIPEDLDINSRLKDGKTLLINAIISKEKNKYQKIDFLIKNGADINMRDCYKYFLTPLSHAVKAGDIKAFDILLKKGADYNKGSMDETTESDLYRGNEGNTPLMIAAWHGRKDFVDRLCEQKDICLNQQDSNGFTALIKAAVKKNEYIYKKLSELGADTKIRDRKGHTADWWWNKK